MMSREIRIGFRLLAISAVALALGGCGGGGGGGGSTATSTSTGSGGGGTTGTAATETVLHSFAGPAGDGSFPDNYGRLVQASDGNLYGVTYDGGTNNQGAVIKISTSGAETLLYSFGATKTDAAYPLGGLIQASDGNLYGMSSAGGATASGTVFKISMTGVESVVYSFGAYAGDGFTPMGGLMQASDGNFYGVTSGGGANSLGTAFKVTAAGVETVLHSFAGGAADGDTPMGNLVQASDGNLYGVTRHGGANSSGTVFRVTTAGAETTLWSFGGAGDGTNPLNGLVQASDGNLYGMTNSGGTGGFGTIFRITTAGAETVLHSFAGATGDGSYPLGGLIQASDGNLYGLTQWGGAANAIGLGAAFRITTSGAETLLYSFGVTAGDGQAPVGSLVQASDGHFYGMTYQGGTANYGTVFRIN